MNNLKINLWKTIKGPLQWRALWLAHSKFIIGVAGVMLNEDHEVLLLKHKYWPNEAWGLPGGYVNSGEKLEEALIREVKEETGYKADIGQLLQINSGYQLRLEVIYEGMITGGTLKLDENEIMESGFFPLQETPATLLESHKNILKHYRGVSKE